MSKLSEHSLFQLTLMRMREFIREPEALFCSAKRLADRGRDAGVPVTFSLVADSVHSFVLFDFLPETDRALAEFAAFARTVPAD